MIDHAVVTILYFAMHMKHCDAHPMVWSLWMKLKDAATRLTFKRFIGGTCHQDE